MQWLSILVLCLRWLLSVFFAMLSSSCEFCVLLLPAFNTLTADDENTRHWQSIQRCQGRVFSSDLSCYESCADKLSRRFKCNKSMLGVSDKKHTLAV